MFGKGFGSYLSFMQTNYQGYIMTTMANAMRTAQRDYKAKMDYETKIYIGMGYRGYNRRNSNPLKAPNFHQRLFLISINRELSKVFLGNMST